MSRPGITLRRVSTRPAQSPPTATGPWFVAGKTGTADTDARGVRKPVISLSEYAARFGSRTAHGANPEVYDNVESYFLDGGSQVFVSPTADLLDPALQAAVDKFTIDLGPGQVSSPGRTTSAQRLILGTHAANNNRVFVGAVTNTGTLATLVADAVVTGASLDSDRVSSLFGPWITVPVAGGGGATRTISPEGIVAAAMSRNDARNVSPNQPSAGEFGVSDIALDVAFSFSDADRATLNSNGINLLRSMYNGVRLYGYRTLADPSADDLFVNLGNARLLMAIQAEIGAIAERFVLRQIDGARTTISEFGGAITGVLIPFWTSGALYGATAGEAFKVDVGPNVNTDDTIKARELHANIQLRMSEFAEEVIIDLVKVSTGESL